ncbi:MAG: DEAD/DEAH box helicase [Planctomycetota bacterium]
MNSSSSAKGAQPLHLEIRATGASPWPGLALRADAVLPQGRVPLDNLQTAEGVFSYNNLTLKADPLDALLIRTIKQLPLTADGAHRAGARDFARVLALLRQASDNCTVIEEGRIGKLEVLEDPARASLHILPAPNSEIQGAASLRFIARTSYRCAETGRVLGQPISRDASYWTFETAVTPPPTLPDDPLLRGLFEKSALPSNEFGGIEALDLLCRARTNANRFKIQIDPAIIALGINFEPLREKISVSSNAAGDLEVVRELFTSTGTPVIFPSILVSETMAPIIAGQLPGSLDLEKSKSPQSSAENEWHEVDGIRHRLPKNFSGNSLAKLLTPELPRSNPCQARHTLSGDDIPTFVLDVLPKLKQLGASVARDVDAIDVCLNLKPSLNLEAADDGNPERVHASFYFEPAVPFRKQSTVSHDGSLNLEGNARDADAPKVSISPVEILAAASQGKRFIRQGNAFFRVDRELVAGCRKKLEEAGAQSLSGFDASDEQIPQLLAWARKAAHDEHTPWNCYISESVDGAHHIKDEAATVRVKLDVDEDEGQDAWFALTATFDHGGVHLTEEEMRKLADEGREWFNKNGTWIHVDKKALATFDQNLKEVGAALPEEDLPLFGHHKRKKRKKFYYRFRPDVRERLTDVFSIAGTVTHNERYKKFLDQLMGFEEIQSIPLPTSLKVTPRPYQQKGFEWLSFLSRYGLNGVLADDMGLGKTMQTIAQLTRMKEEFGFMPSLIVTPTSLADNWKNEFQKFSPTMRCMIYRGSPTKRDKLRGDIAPPDIAIGAPDPDPTIERKGFDIVIATLGTVRNDVSLLRQVPWQYVIVDEAHFIKNAAAGVAKAIKTIPARHRLALTGTPIQNRLTELWSLFDFLMPGFLGRQSHFTQQYEEPIMLMQSGRAETEEQFTNGKNAAERLRQKIFPFVLRRLKTDVAKDLPPKIESDIFCPLTAEQTALYRSFGDSEEAKKAVSDIVEKGDASTPAILAALISLRKICNHPDLMYLPKNSGRQRVTDPVPGYETRSGKLEALGELLEECREGGHRALIFCQLTSMMDILGHYVTGKGMKYLRIDGETPGMSRQKLVEQFNGDPSIETFLISTRAGGAGLNLTGADTVIFYDHDWNPANDQQAQDRAYRIGQKRTVNVYRLICKGTLEEKILRRQALKKALASSIVTHDNAGVKALTREELLSLFTLSE